MDILNVSDISKKFGSKQVLDRLSFQVPEHSIYGFIGKNGAGKTTTMKLILGLSRADEGQITVHGEPVHYGCSKSNRYIGYLPDVPEFYGYMTAPEYLRFCADITGLAYRQAKEKIPEMLDMVGLSHEKKRIQGFSRGMKQRLGIAQALLHSPEFLVCDEPTSALDPVGRKEVLDILRTVSSRTTILFSTHILPDVERICDRIGILHEGSLAWQGNMEDVHRLGHNQGFEIEFQKPEDACRFEEIWRKTAEQRASKQAAESLEGLLFGCLSGDEGDMRRAMDIVLSEKLAVRRMEMREPTLESLFMEVMKQ